MSKVLSQPDAHSPAEKASEPALSVRGLTGGHHGLVAVRDVTFDVADGEVLTILGPNGAGKSTTLLSIVGVLRRMGGEVLSHGETLGSKPEVNARRGVTLVPDDRGVFHQLSVADNLRLTRNSADLESVLDDFPKLRSLWKRRCGLLSGGEQQMLALAKALLQKPKVLLVDELSLGLAPKAAQELMPILRHQADERGLAVVLVEQHVDLALSIADTAAVLRHGRIELKDDAALLREQRHRIEDAYFGRQGHDPSSH
ncbi:ABC transporter ATP-binding protein [Nocardioides yefusunii]|uniref:ABC transporter ATP-binding protein n=1 Tax=Nocardioides yefusunii TaxID=2500546 RepID=A0ABW1QVI7_9ACTN|nr:ATP-binding cassette domain-containing protein [Nocardioides yefusunii]